MAGGAADSGEGVSQGVGQEAGVSAEGMSGEEQRSLKALLASAISQGLSDHERAERDRKGDELVGTALSAAKKAYRDRRANRLDQATGKVGSYCATARKDVWKAVHKDERMPHAINWKQRYGAFLGMQDREEFLRRLGQTLDDADRILAAQAETDVAGVMEEAAADYAARVSRLNGIAVEAPADIVDDRTAQPAVVMPGDADNAEVDGAIENAFRDVLGEDFDIEAGEAGRARDTADRLMRALEGSSAAIDLAIRAAERAARPAAAALAGRMLQIPDAPAFKAEGISRAKGDVEQICRLAALVRSSYGTFSQVVRDNGLYAAFSHDRMFGRRHTGACDIPDVVKKEKTDSLARAIKRMEEFNAKPYDGLFDDDFSAQVTGFWYGFKKLMKALDKLADINTGPLDDYCNTMADSAKNAVVALGAASMDDHQLRSFCDEVDRREQQERKH